MELQFDKTYWNKRYIENETGWDIGYISTPLKEYFDQLNNKGLRILIPGAGNAYEAEYLFNTGFKNTFVVDISEEACENFKARNPKFPASQVLCENYFNINGSYDLMIEQTFFCAIHPNKRHRYVEKAHQILSPKGKLVGLLFQKKLFEDHPPFGGSKTEYINLFEPHFDIEIMETSHNSIPPRKDAELFIKLTPK